MQRDCFCWETQHSVIPLSGYQGAAAAQLSLRAFPVKQQAEERLPNKNTRRHTAGSCAQGSTGVEQSHCETTAPKPELGLAESCRLQQKAARLSKVHGTALCPPHSPEGSPVLSWSTTSAPLLLCSDYTLLKYITYKKKSGSLPQHQSQ